MFKYSLDNKRNNINYFFRNKFGFKVVKVSLNGNFSCPNFKNGQGCIFCAHGSGNRLEHKSLKEQFEIIKKPLDKKWKDAKYIAYLQANTNTYAPIDVLKKVYTEALSLPNVIGLDIATRSDALNDDVLDYLEELNKKTFLIVELGLQSCHDTTLKFIKRGHDVNNFQEAVKKLKERGIFVVAHIINGIPGESKEMMIETAKFLNEIGINGIKIHMLYISPETELASMYQKEKFPLLSWREYVDIVCEQLRYLNDKIVIFRISSSPEDENFMAPKWLEKRKLILNEVDKEMKKRDIYQGDKVTSS